MTETIIRRGKESSPLLVCKQVAQRGKKSAHIEPLFEEKDSFTNTNQAPDFVSIAIFHAKITEGPYFICVVCNRMLYQQSVLLVHKANYTRQDLLTTVKSFDSKEYVCFTCHRKVKQGKIPCQAVRNKLELDEIPPELADLGKLEAILISRRIVFQKIVRQQCKIKGTICNVLVDCETVCHSLPRPSETSGIILLKLKRKLEYKGYQYYQPVRPEFLQEALEYLKKQ